MGDVIFNCPHCEQELAVDASAAGTEIECPSCGQPITIPESAVEGGAAVEGTGAPAMEKNPIMASAAAKEEKHFKVPQHEKKAPAEPAIEKPLPSLDASAKEGIALKIKTFKRSDTVEVGKDHFDEVVTKFLSKIGESNIVSVSPINYAHQDLASHAWINDFGVLIVYKG